MYINTCTYHAVYYRKCLGITIDNGLNKDVVYITTLLPRDVRNFSSDYNNRNTRRNHKQRALIFFFLKEKSCVYRDLIRFPNISKSKSWCCRGNRKYTGGINLEYTKEQVCTWTIEHISTLKYTTQVVKNILDLEVFRILYIRRVFQLFTIFSLSLLAWTKFFVPCPGDTVKKWDPSCLSNGANYHAITYNKY